MVSTSHTSEPVVISTCFLRVKAWSSIERLHIVNSMSVLDNTGRRGGGHVFITAVTAVTLARHIPTKDFPIYTGPSRLRGIEASQIEGPKKRERRETLTVEWSSRRSSSFTLLSSALHLTPPFMKIQIDRQLLLSMLSAEMTPQPHAPGDKMTRKGSLFDLDEWMTERRGVRFVSPTSLFFPLNITSRPNVW